MEIDTSFKEHYHELGKKGAPILILVHGMAVNYAMWKYQEVLAEDYHLVMPDLPGHGLRQDEVFDMDSAVEEIRFWIEENANGAPVYLSGLSLGGYVAQKFMIKYPHLIKAAILSDSSAKPVWPWHSLFSIVFKIPAILGSSGMVKVYLKFFKLVLDGQYVEHVRAHQVSPFIIHDVIQEVHKTYDFGSLKSFDKPVLIINGQFDWFRLHERSYRRVFKDSRKRIIKKAGHISCYPAFENYNKCISDFLSSLS